VRKIAANNFRLPAADRSKFEKLPHEVIARIERIVLDAYLEAGEDVGGDIFREHLWQQALAARLGMVANGELISEADFRQRLGVTPLRKHVLRTVIVAGRRRYVLRSKTDVYVLLSRHVPQRAKCDACGQPKGIARQPC
jgi:hypothetical protein